MACATDLPNASNPAILGNHELSGRIFMASNQLEARNLKSIPEQTAAGFLDAPMQGDQTSKQTSKLGALETQAPMDASGPNDPEFALQANLRLIGLPRAWQNNITTRQVNTRQVLVAVLDDGYDASLFDMTNRIDLPTPPPGHYLDSADRDNDPRATQKSHGSAVAPPCRFGCSIRYATRSGRTPRCLA